MLEYKVIRGGSAVTQWLYLLRLVTLVQATARGRLEERLELAAWPQQTGDLRIGIVN
jgi:hypothetical protein